MEYWNEACPNLTHASEYVANLDKKRVKISTIYMDGDAKEEFEKMAETTGALSQPFDLKSESSDEELTNLIAMNIMANINLKKDEEEPK